ncbi:membrane-spanning 4-domains subfamily A member 4A isoform X2 [Echinops telfairi]|uniref:Membrane-spanning 4-domains subfamily A member 4A isoform X2 n=1 Tax=Echinops telfairi TaxID=9371 RepID=A0AC55DMQ4_ECHTE|nr:membrane-spanning 4-domains subfamily A member 4A isoform X2 [Echinops telfairi]
MQQTTSELDPGVPQMGQPAAVKSYLWKGRAEKFLKGEPKILGVVQILIALMNLSLGIIMMCATLPFYGRSPISVFMAYTVWGSVMIQGSLGLNIASSTLAAIGIIISAISLISFPYHHSYCSYQTMPENCALVSSILRGMDGVVLVLSVLQFCVAVSLSAFGCKVACCNSGGIVFVMPSNPHVAETAPTAPFSGYLTPPAEQQRYIP